MMGYRLQATGYRPGNFRSVIILVTLCLCVLAVWDYAVALNFDQVRVHFLNGDYRRAISEGEKIIAVSKPISTGLDRFYYILGLSYMKNGNYLRASDIFEIILSEFRSSKIKQEAKLALADTYFLNGDYPKARVYYKEIVNSRRARHLRSTAYYRLSRIAFKEGDTQEAKKYLEKLKSKYPLSVELQSDKNISFASSGFFYTVQVGAFSSKANAENLREELSQKGYSAYTEEMASRGKITYRVRVGKFNRRQDALSIEKRLSLGGYPTKIYP